MFKSTLYLVVILASLCETNAYRILVVFPLPGKSHSILGEAMVEHLANAGHEVTYITAFPPEKPLPKVTMVDISDNLKYFPSGAMNIKKVMDKTGESNSFFYFAPMLMNMSRTAMAHSNVQKLIADESKEFDAVIAEWMFNEVYAGFAGVYRSPFIWFSSVEPHWLVVQLVDEMPNPAYTLDILSKNMPPLTFTQRVGELFSQIFGKLIKIFWLSRLENDLYKEFFVPVIRKRRNSVPSLETLKYNSSLLLSNSHVSMGIPARLPNNVISIGGFHVKRNVKPLPEVLQTLMDNAKHGVIYFSMGSNLRSKHFPDEVKQNLLKMFGKLKQTVLWKFEEDLPNRPSNVHIVEWAPQQSILGHKNCIIFITHGGLLSTTETIHFGVPTIGIPVFADQFVNVERSVKKGFAQKVDLSYTMAADLQIAIKKILDNPEYTLKAKQLSQIYHDRPVPPSKELVHWVEHVIKTPGGLHLRSPAFLVPLYQKLYLDLILVLIITILLLKYVFIFVKNKISKQRKEKVN